jgi:hypothetical protein
MANQEHLDLARKGRKVWNEHWARANVAPLDFSGIDFSNNENKSISFAGFLFRGEVNFRKSRFGHAPTAFWNDPYESLVRDSPTDGAAIFIGAIFHETSDFSGCQFGSGTNFNAAIFFKDANFGESCRFQGDCRFEGAVFQGKTNFFNASFDGHCSFRGWPDESRAFQDFGRIVSKISEDRKLAWFSVRPNAAARTSFGDANFRSARFSGRLDFEKRILNGEIEFSHASFDYPPSFIGTANRERLNFANAHFYLTKHKYLSYGKSETTADFRRLRGIAKEIHAADAERDLFLLERKAESQALWRLALDTQWWSPFRKVLNSWRAYSTYVLLSSYYWASNCGRSVIRPLILLCATNTGAYLAYESAILPKTTIVGRTARGTWGWVKSWFSSDASTTTTSITAEQYKALFEFWWASAVPLGTLPRSAYEKAVTTLYGVGGAPAFVHVMQFGQFSLNALSLFLIALALRNHFRVSGPSGG